MSPRVFSVLASLVLASCAQTRQDVLPDASSQPQGQQERTQAAGGPRWTVRARGLDGIDRVDLSGTVYFATHSTPGAVVDGVWVNSSSRSDFVVVAGLILDGEPYSVRDWDISIENGGARCIMLAEEIQPPMLWVVDRDTSVAVTSVEVVVSKVHPSRNPEAESLGVFEASPIELPLSVAFRDLWVRAPGFAWTRRRALDAVGGAELVALPRISD